MSPLRVGISLAKESVMHRFTCKVVVLGLALILSPEVTRAAVTFTDGTFTNADWTVTTDTDANGTGTSSGAQLATGGNPGEFRQVSVVVQPAQIGAVFSTVVGYHQKTSAVYNPATQGAIVSVDYSEDAMNISGGGQATGVALRQNGVIYAGPTLITSGSGWLGYPQSGLSANQFNDIDNFQSGGLHPDFSATGAPITFGFFRAQSARFNSTSMVGIDNWSVTVNQIPEPGSLATAACLLSALWRKPRNGQKGHRELT
jgi:hypothetical protein